MSHAIVHTIAVDTPPAVLWSALTDLAVMKRWMGEPEMKVEVVTDWIVGHPIVITGFHHARFENRGIVVRFEPAGALAYTHLSSLSRLPDVPESYSTIEHVLVPLGGSTSWTLTIRGFATESIRKHLELYWLGTLPLVKRLVEGRA